jgi:hypothetical protein
LVQNTFSKEKTNFFSGDAHGADGAGVLWWNVAKWHVRVSIFEKPKLKR